MNIESQSKCSWPKWVIFAVFLITVPVPFYMVVVGGLVPLCFILFHAVQGLIVALPKFTGEGFWMLGILWAHVIILGALLYVVAHGISWVLFRALSHRYALFVVFALVVALLGTSIFEVYRLPGHNSAPPANILRIIKALAT